MSIEPMAFLFCLVSVGLILILLKRYHRREGLRLRIQRPLKLSVQIWVFQFIFSIVFVGTSSQAYEFFPEYMTLQQTDREKFVRPKLFDSETSSDTLTYTRSMNWDYWWLAHDNAFNASIGSISSENFLIDNNLKLKKQLGAQLSLKFIFTEQDDFRRHSLRHLLELEYRLSQRFSLALYGQPSFEKAKDDTGLAMIFGLNPNHRLRLFYTAVDFDRNKRNAESDEWSRQPWTAGVVGRWVGEKDKKDQSFFEYAYRQESKARWLFPDDDYEFHFWRSFWSVKSRTQLNSHRYMNFSLNGRRQLQENQPLSASSPISYEKSKMDLYEGLIQYEWPGLNLGPILAGLKYVDRFWKTELGSIRHQNWLPHFWFTKQRKAHRWKVGWETTFHRGRGPRKARSKFDPNWGVEHRLNTAVEWEIFENGYLSLMFTFDGDELGGEESWEGGNGQLQVFF